MRDVMQAAKERADKLGVRNVVVATNSGASVLAAQETFGSGYRFFAVGNPASARERGLCLHTGIGEDTRRALEAKGITVITQDQSLFQADDRTETGPALHDAAVLGIENGWYIGEKKVMRERVWLRTHAASATARVIDVALTWTAIGAPVTLWGAAGKSYGGFTVRFNTRVREKKGGISPKQVDITVPSGPCKGKDLAKTRLKWADFVAPFPGARGKSGAAVFVDDTHPDYPPTWLTRHYGCLCVGWPGVEPGTLEPGKPVTCHYRLLIHRGDLDFEALKKAYDQYIKREKEG